MFGFVVLHYNEKTLVDTLNCAESIRSSFAAEEFHICIVENGSADNSSVRLHSRYDTVDHVTVLDSEENLGFAGGNNLGFLWLKENKPVSYIFVLNNDTLLKQKNMAFLIKEEFKKSQFHIMGPDIRSRDGASQNPQPSLVKDLPSLEKLQSKCEASLVRLKLMKKEDFVRKDFRKQIKSFLKKMIIQIFFLRLLEDARRKKKGRRLIRYTQRMEDVGLHGAAVLYSSLYIRKYDVAFHPDTFMYKEEDLLYCKALNDGLKMVYNPFVRIKHLEDSSTDSTHGKTLGAEIFKLTETLKSLNVLKKYLLSQSH